MKGFTFAALAIGIGVWLLNTSLTDQRRHASAEDMTGHGADHGVFRPEEIKWMAGPPSLPPGAQFAVLEGDMSVSTALPCRISVYEREGKTILATLKPTALLALFGVPHLEHVAREVEDVIVQIMKEAAATN